MRFFLNLNIYLLSEKNRRSLSTMMPSGDTYNGDIFPNET